MWSPKKDFKPRPPNNDKWEKMMEEWNKIVAEYNRKEEERKARVARKLARK